MPTFDQILQMDDDDDRDFSKEIVYGFFDQAESTFVKMDEAMYVFYGPPFWTGVVSKVRFDTNFFYYQVAKGTFKNSLN